MSFVLSNHQKAVVFSGDILEGDGKFSQDDSLVVQNLDYNFERTCNSNGIPFGITANPVVEFSIRFMEDCKVKSFFSLLNDNDLVEFSLVFGATFDANRKTCDYQNAIVLSGYVVEVDQDYSYNESSTGEFQRLLKIRFLAAEVTYAGSQSNKTLVISNRI